MTSARPALQTAAARGGASRGASYSAAGAGRGQYPRPPFSQGSSLSGSQGAGRGYVAGRGGSLGPRPQGGPTRGGAYAARPAGERGYAGGAPRASTSPVSPTSPTSPAAGAGEASADALIVGAEVSGEPSHDLLAAAAAEKAKEKKLRATFRETDLLSERGLFALYREAGRLRLIRKEGSEVRAEKCTRGSVVRHRLRWFRYSASLARRSFSSEAVMLPAASVALRPICTARVCTPLNSEEHGASAAPAHVHAGI